MRELQQIIDQGTQAAKIIAAKPGTSRRCQSERIKLIYVSPRSQHRRQLAVGVVEHDTILTPVLTASRQMDSGAAQRMEWMSDLDRYAFMIVITASSC
jgi:hypothetical protein